MSDATLTSNPKLTWRDGFEQTPEPAEAATEESKEALPSRLREQSTYLFPKAADTLMCEAADEIERLQGMLDACEQHVKILQEQQPADEPATARVLLRQLLNAIHIAWTTRQLSNAWMERPEIPKLLLDADRAAAPPHCNPERTAQPPEPAHDLNELLEIARDIASMDCFHAANGWCEPECPCLAARAGRAVHRAPPTKSDGAS